MPEPLKHQFGPEIAHRLAQSISSVFSAFAETSFLTDALSGYESLELIPRAQHLATALQKHLPKDFNLAIDLSRQSIAQDPLNLDHMEILARLTTVVNQ